MKFRCIIIDDEPLAVEVIQTHLSEFSNMELVGVFNDPIEALKIMKKNNIDAVFLDINMPKMNGLEFIRSVGPKTNFIVTTAYREYAVESFDLDVMDYLVKPIPFARFLKSINKLSQKILSEIKDDQSKESKEKSFIFLKVNKKLVKVKFEDILYIESLKDYVKVFTVVDNYLVHKSLTGITEELPSDQFLRIHRSFTIALDKIKEVEGNTVQINNKRIPIGRKYLNYAKSIILDDIE